MKHLEIENFVPKKLDELPTKVKIEMLVQNWTNPSQERKEIFVKGDQKEKDLLKETLASPTSRRLVEISRMLGHCLRENPDSVQAHL